jgi:hypothetical protein
VSQIGAALLQVFIPGAIFAQVTSGGLTEVMQRAKAPLRCPLCKARFSRREFQNVGRACPHCKVPLGYPYWYRVLLVAAYLCAGGYVMYAGCKGGGPDANGWLLAGLPFAFVAGVVAQVLVLRVIPPKLVPHAEGSTWLKLT